MTSCPTCREDIDSDESEDNEDDFGVYEEDTESEISYTRYNNTVNENSSVNSSEGYDDSDSDGDYTDEGYLS